MSMTMVDAINELVETIMEFPMSGTTRPSLQNDTTSIYARAEDFVERESMRVQATGWPENTDVARKFEPAGDRITLTPNVLRVRGAGPDAHRTLVIRSETVTAGNPPVVTEFRRVYDANRQTFQIDSPIYLDAVVLLDFNTLPRTLQDVIVSSAKMRFQRRMQGSQSADQQLAMEYMQAEFIADRNRIKQDAVPFNPRPMVPGGQPEAEES